MDVISSFANSTVALIVVLGIIIFFHESGHFLLAKAFGMRVFIFSFGFGKRLFGFTRGDTDYRVSLIPLGGYVKLEGEPDDVISEDTAPRGDGNDFLSRPRWQRLIVYFAGPAMNAVLAVLTFTIIFMLGVGVPGVRYDQPTIGAIDPGSPAAAAGLEPGDTITTFDGEVAEDWEQVQIGILMRPNRDITMEVARGAQRLAKTVHSRMIDERMGDIGVFPLVRIGQVLKDSPAEAAGLKPDDGLLRVAGAPLQSFADVPEKVRAAKDQPIAFEILRGEERLTLNIAPKEGRVGIGEKFIVKKFGFVRAFKEAGRETWDRTVQMVGLLKQLLTFRVAAKSALSGPIGIAQAAGEAARTGIVSLLFLIALLSISVGVLNLFPMAPLDGGHIAVLLAEMLIRRELSEKVKLVFMNAGFVLIMALMVFIVYSDLSKLPWLSPYLP
ncbi:MAG: RIP metalloprotease RseP [Vicinamibacteria bacterium]|nr:RIP metalloprotease RseP [Vicinamibacteria bacterium]